MFNTVDRPSEIRSLSLHWLSSLVVLSLLFMTGCDGVSGLNDDEDPSFSKEVAHESLSADAPKTEAVAEGQYGDLQEGASLVIRNQEEFATLWEQLHSHQETAPTLPDVDFSQKTVVAIIMGAQPTGGYSVHVDEVRLNEDENAAQIRYAEVSPGDNCSVTMATTSPYVIASFDPRVEDASFSGTSEVRSCPPSE